MKKVLFVFALCAEFISFGQQSFQFSDPQPYGVSSVSTTDANHFGTYKNEETGATYVINKEGIFIEVIQLGSVSREQVRESSKLRVSGSWLHGIKPNDSVPCIEEGELYYYGIPQQKMIIGSGSLNTLTKISPNEYIINFHEGMYFEPSQIKWVNGNLQIIHPDLKYTQDCERILKVASIQQYNFPIAILSPTNAQWEQLSKMLFKDAPIVYKKQ